MGGWVLFCNPNGPPRSPTADGLTVRDLRPYERALRQELKTNTGNQLPRRCYEGWIFGGTLATDSDDDDEKIDCDGASSDERRRRRLTLPSDASPRFAELCACSEVSEP